MSILGLFTGTHTYLVGVEDDPDGGLRCYLGARYKGLYCVVEGEDEKAEILRAWNGYGGHIAFPVPPPECIYCDRPEAHAMTEEQS